MFIILKMISNPLKRTTVTIQEELKLVPGVCTNTLSTNITSLSAWIVILRLVCQFV